MYTRSADGDLAFEWDEADIEHIARHDVRPEEIGRQRRGSLDGNRSHE
jgi:hypothetical protein